MLSVSLTCCNRDAPNAPGIGDIRLPTDSSPAQAAFSNISVPTPMQARPREDLDYWLYLSYRSANPLPQASSELLSAMRSLYIGDNRAAPERVAVNRRCRDAILEFSSEEEECLIRERLYRGRRLKLVIDPAGFGSFCGMCLSASALESFSGASRPSTATRGSGCATRQSMQRFSLLGRRSKLQGRLDCHGPRALAFDEEGLDCGLSEIVIGGSKA